MKWHGYLRAAASVLLAVSVSGSLQAQDAKEPKAGDKKPGESDMMAMMMELAQPGENHKRMGDMVGTWAYTVKWWMSPEAPPAESTGTTVTKPAMDGRYFISDHTGKMQLPGPDGKMVDMVFKGMAIEGFDNAKKKFVSSWIDNMGTGIMNSEGTYDEGTKTLTYTAEYEPMPGMKTKVRQVIKMVDKDHHTMEFFEMRGEKEVKTMEMAYTRKT